MVLGVQVFVFVLESVLYSLNLSSWGFLPYMNWYCCANSSALSTLRIANSFVLCFSSGMLFVFLMPLLLLIWFHASFGYVLMFM